MAKNSIDYRMEKIGEKLVNSLQNYIFLQRLRECGDDELITQFEKHGFNTIRSRENARFYMELMPTSEELLKLINTISKFI